MSKVKQIKIALLALVAALVIAIPTSAFAADYSITINSTGNVNASTHTYQAYQVFSGTLSENGVLSDIAWGNGVNDSTLLPALKANATIGSEFASAASAEDVAGVLEGKQDDSAFMKTFADVVSQHLGTAAAEFAGGTAAEIDLPGYYIVKNKDNTVTGQQTAATEFVLKVVGKAVATVKADVPDVDKFIKEDTGNVWGESADFEIGQDISYHLVGTLPANYDEYETYKYIFHDAFENQVLVADSVKVYSYTGDIADHATSPLTPINAGWSTTSTAAGDTLTVAFDNLKTAGDFTSATKILVEYKAKLTSAAKKGNPGNDNKVYLEFSNNPNQGGSGETGKTPEHWTVAFTYDLISNKVIKDTETQLEGAEFILLNADKTMVYIGSDETGKALWEAVAANTDSYIGNSKYSTMGAKTFSFVGLDDEDFYYLREIKAPTDYNKLTEDIKVQIQATRDSAYTGDAEAATVLQKLELYAGNDTKIEKIADGNITDGNVAQNIGNTKGNELPSTGGIGTTIFTVVGIALIVVAAVIAIMRRRNSTTA